MFTSFFTGISGLTANATALNVVGNNLANVNTIGFKSDVISFQDILSSTLMGVNFSGNPLQVGLGVNVAGITGNFNQGSVKTTTQPTDLAIIGNGFFILKDGNNQYYTRAGNFTLDDNGRLVTQQGYAVQGWTATSGVVNSNAPVSDLLLTPGLSIAPSATDAARLDMNFDADTEVGGTFATSIRVFDSLGTAHTVTFTFTKTAVGDWSYSIASADGAFTPANPATGTLEFDDNGQLTQVDGAAPADVGLTLGTLTNGAADINFDWQVLNDQGSPVITQYASQSNTSQTSITGYPPGSLSTFAVDAAGMVQGIFDNGQVSLLGQIAMASFNNPQGLVKNGRNSYSESLASGAPAVGQAGTGGRGSLTGNALELSNVDIATEFTSLIIAQRGYQANSRVITTSDEVTQEAINLKR